MTTEHRAVRRLTRREVLRLAAFAPAAGLVLTACGRDEPELIQAVSENPDRQVFDVRDLQALLDRRAQAQLAGDEEGFLADLDPSNTEMLERERLEFANLQRFEVADIRYATGQVGKTGRYEPPPHPFEERTEPYAFMPVIKAVRLSADADLQSVSGPGEAFEYLVDRRGGRWAVVDIVPMSIAEQERRKGSDQGFISTNIPPAHAPWHHDALQVINVGNVWLVADDSVGDLGRYAAEAAAEAERAEEMWGDRPRFPGHVLFFTRRKKTLARWYEAGRDADASGLREGYALGISGVRDDGTVYPSEYAGARNLIFLPAVDEHGWGYRLTMRHELTHTVTRRAYGTGDNPLFTTPPTWAVEGFATYISVRGMPAEESTVRQIALQGFDGTFPNSDAFQRGNARRVGTNYAVSATVFRFVERMADMTTAIDFYRELIKWDDGPRFGVYEPFVTKPAFDGVCRTVLDMGSVTFHERWSDFVRSGA